MTLGGNETMKTIEGFLNRRGKTIAILKHANGSVDWIPLQRAIKLVQTGKATVKSERDKTLEELTK